MGWLADIHIDQFGLEIVKLSNKMSEQKNIGVGGLSDCNSGKDLKNAI